MGTDSRQHQEVKQVVRTSDGSDVAVSNTTPSTPVAQEKPPASEVDRKAAFLRVRERMNHSRLAITPPTGKAGYWANRNNESEMSRLDYLGLSVVKETDPKKPRWKAFGLREDGTYQQGDLILMECDAVEYAALKEISIDRARDQQSNAKDTFLQEAEEAGVPTFKINRR